MARRPGPSRDRYGEKHGRAGRFSGFEGAMRFGGLGERMDVVHRGPDGAVAEDLAVSLRSGSPRFAR